MSCRSARGEVKVARPEPPVYVLSAKPARGVVPQLVELTAGGLTKLGKSCGVGKAANFYLSAVGKQKEHLPFDGLDVTPLADLGEGDGAKLPPPTGTDDALVSEIGVDLFAVAHFLSFSLCCSNSRVNTRQEYKQIF